MKPVLTGKFRKGDYALMYGHTIVRVLGFNPCTVRVYIIEHKGYCHVWESNLHKITYKD